MASRVLLVTLLVVLVCTTDAWKLGGRRFRICSSGDGQITIGIGANGDSSCKSSSDKGLDIEIASNTSADPEAAEESEQAPECQKRTKIGHVFFVWRCKQSFDKFSSSSPTPSIAPEVAEEDGLS